MKKRLFFGVVLIIIIILSVTTIIFKHASLTKSASPAMSVFEKALVQQIEGKQIVELVNLLEKQGIEVIKTGCIDDKTIKDFLCELIGTSEELKDIFRKYGKAGITIYISNRYEVFNGAIWINAREGVKKTAKWLAEGKI